MEIIKKEHKLCLCCMTKHEVQTVRFLDEMPYQGILVEYAVECEYCDIADIYFSVEEQITHNFERLREAYCKIVSSPEALDKFSANIVK